MIEWVRGRRDKMFALAERGGRMRDYYRGQWAAYQDVLFHMGQEEE